MINLPIRDCLILDIKDVKKGVGYNFNFLQTWRSFSINFELYLNGINKYIIVTIDNKKDNTKSKQRIELAYKPSNLGKGKILYFLCPVLNKYCRKLYLYKNSNGFASRDGYKRINIALNYPYQRLSRKERHFYLRDHFERKFHDLRDSKKMVEYYDGKETKTTEKLKLYDMSFEKYDDILLTNLLEFLHITYGECNFFD